MSSSPLSSWSAGPLSRPSASPLREADRAPEVGLGIAELKALSEVDLVLPPDVLDEGLLERFRARPIQADLQRLGVPKYPAATGREATASIGRLVDTHRQRAAEPALAAPEDVVKAARMIALVTQIQQLRLEIAQRAARDA